MELPKCAIYGMDTMYESGRWQRTTNRANLPDRDYGQIYSDGVQGEAATYAMIQAIKSMGISVRTNNTVTLHRNRVGQMIASDGDVDIEISKPCDLPGVTVWHTVSLKSSTGDVQRAVAEWDFKLFPKGNSTFEEDFNTAMIIQSYWPESTKREHWHINWGAVLEILTTGVPVLSNGQRKALYQELRLSERLHGLTIVGICCRADAIQYQNRLNESFRRDRMAFGGSAKELWNLKIRRVGRPFHTLPEVLSEGV